VAITKVFKSGNSQAVRIPRAFQFDTDKVEILRRGDEIVLREPAPNLRGAFDLLASLPKDFMRGGRRQGRPQKRRGL